MSEYQLPLEYVSRPAKVKSENTPVLFMLHGYGSNEDDLFSFASELPEELFIISLRAPYKLMPFGYAWYAINFDAEQGKWSDDKQALASRELIVEFIDKACDKYELDKGNITLLGFSQGSILSYSVALSYPDKIKNVIALSGYINQGIITDWHDASDYRALHIYASHGYADQVIPVEWARRTPEILKKYEIDHTYEEFPVGHGVSPQNFYAFNSWLKAHL